MYSVFLYFVYMIVSKIYKNKILLNINGISNRCGCKFK